MALLIETMNPAVALDEVRALHVMDLHAYPIHTTLRFADERDKIMCWTTSREHLASLMAESVNVLSPKQYAQLLAAQDETVGDVEHRLKLRLFAVELVTAERKGGT